MSLPDPATRRRPPARPGRRPARNAPALASLAALEAPAVLAVLCLVAAGFVATAPARAASAALVISRAYGGGGNSGATLTSDYIELYNRGTTPVSVGGWSVQYASAGGTTWQLTRIGAGTVPPGGYLLVQEATGSGGTQALPGPDATGSIAMSASSGKVALVSSEAALSCGATAGSCAGSVVDLVGYGSASDYEGSGPAPVLGNTTAAARAADGATDTDDNRSDFTARAATDPAPRTNAQSSGTAPTVTSTTPSDGAAGVPLDSTLTVTFSEAVVTADGWYDVTCGSGSHPAAASGGPTTYTLDPDTDFQNSEVCTVTVRRDGVTDGEGRHPAADVTSRFSTVAADPCASDYTHTYGIQGAGRTSPLAGRTVTTQGVVVADFQRSDQLAGFALQDVAGDGDAATSDGLFIFGPSAPDVAVGDVVRVTGAIKEFSGQTVMTYSGSTPLVACGTAGVPAPTTAHLPESVDGELERYEGMLVAVPETLTVQQSFFLGRYGQLTLGSGGRRSTPTNVYPARSPEAVALAGENARSLISLDDASTRQNPNPIPYLDANDTRRAGDTVTGLTGLLDEGPINTSTTSNLDYRIQPTRAPSFTPGNPRTTGPAAVGGNLKVASFNVLNYFTTLTSENPAARGADTAEEFARQRTKIFAAMSGIDADVFGLMEIENLPGTQAVQNLVDGLNDYVGDPGRYAAVPDPVTGTGDDAIKVAMVYQPESVKLVGDSRSDPDPVNNRPPMAQTFQLRASSEEVSIVVNHLKSKGSCPIPGTDPSNADNGDGQGCWNAHRAAQAQRLLTFIDSVKASAKDDDVLAIGDFNSYAKEDPILALQAGGLVNEIDRFIGRDAYSYVFDGLSGYLDHGLATASASGQVVGAAEWHLNADEPSVIDYNTNFKTDDRYSPSPYRSSDHDPVVIGMQLGKERNPNHSNG